MGGVSSSLCRKLSEEKELTGRSRPQDRRKDSCGGAGCQVASSAQRVLSPQALARGGLVQIPSAHKAGVRGD